MNAKATLTWTCLCVTAFLGFGCGMVPQAQYDELARQVNPLKEELAKAKKENDDLRADQAAKAKQIDSLIALALDKKRMDLISHATSIELGDFTGAYNTDSLSKASNSVKVYLLPKDAEGSIVKAPGSLQIKLFDLNAPDGKNLIGEVSFTTEQVAKNWYSGFMSMTYHYSFVCPWTRPPTKSEVLVRVEFTDYLTGKHFTAIKTINVQMPASQPVK